MILVFDVETTGVPARGEIISSPFYPHLVEVAGILIDPTNEKERASFSFVVRPDGWEIPEEASKIHGISQEVALTVGVPMAVAMAAFTNLRAAADELAGHNVAFDLQMIQAALHRLGARPAHPGPMVITCTAELGTAIARLPPTDRMIETGYGSKFKKPSLEELYLILFNEVMIGAHGALADCRATARCLLRMRKLAVG
jgi:DNA polymerase-3 subunit epsilon